MGIFYRRYRVPSNEFYFYLMNKASSLTVDDNHTLIPFLTPLALQGQQLQESNTRITPTLVTVTLVEERVLR